MDMTIGFPIPGAIQPQEPVRLIDANKIANLNFRNPYSPSGVDREKYFVYQNAIHDVLERIGQLPTYQEAAK